MKVDIPPELLDWLSHLSLHAQPTQQDIESGRLVGEVMQATVQEYNLQLQTGLTAVNRISNWNNLINELKKIGIGVSQDDKSKIINGNHEIIWTLLQRLKNYYQRNKKQTEVDISKISLDTELNESRSLLELFLLIIMKNFNLNSKEAVALLSNENKYLAHILAKGLKSEFKPIQEFLSDLQKNMHLINNFCKNKENEIFFIRCIKPGLISKSASVSQSSLFLLTQFLQSNLNKYDVVKEHLLTTLLLSIQRHSFQITNVANFLLESSGYSKGLLVLLKNQPGSETQYQNLFNEMWQISKGKNRINEFFSMKGVRQSISECINNIRNSDFAISSLNMLISLCSENDFLSDVDDASSFMENLQKVALSNQGDMIVFIHQLFTLLHILGRDKNSLAPTIYKFLITKYQQIVSEEESRVFIINFEQTLKQFPSIPFNGVVEAINNRIQANTLNISEIQLQYFSYILQNESLDTKTGLLIYNIVSKLIIDEAAYASTTIYILMFLLKKFISENIFIDMTIKLVKVALSVHFANARKIIMKKKSLISGKDVDETILKSKNLAIEKFLMKVTELQNQSINKQNQPLICYSIIQIERISKETKGLRAILEKFGNPDKILKKYEEEVSKMDEESTKKEDKGKNSWGTPNPRYQGSPQSNLNRDSSQINGDDLRKSQNLSYLGVTSAAQKGLQKYHKFYMHKLQKLEQTKNKETEAMEKESKLKKIYERKMLQKGVEVKKVNSENFQYIYEFDQKQKQIEEDTVKSKINFTYYEPTNEEERDIKGLEYLMKKYQRVLKVYYSNYSGHIKPRKLQNFIQISEQYSLLTSTGLSRFIRDSHLDQYITINQSQYLAKKINAKLKKQLQDVSCLDYQGFQKFILQASFAMFTRPPKDLRGRPISEMFEETMLQLKKYAVQNRINEQLFQDPDNVFFNETEAIKELNKKLLDNPEYILPEGYKKIVQKKVVFTHKIFLDAMSSTYKDVYEIVDEILCKAFNVHIVEPSTTYETISKARPALFFNQRLEGQYFSENMSVLMKKEVAKFPIKDREIAKQAAGILDDILDAVELGKKKIGKKLQNKYFLDKKKRQMQGRKLDKQDAKKWAQRDKFIKSALAKHQQVLTEKKKQEREKRKSERKRQQEENKKIKEKEEKMKKKVEQFQENRKKQERKKRKEEWENRKKEQQIIEKKAKQAEENWKKKDQDKKLKQEQNKKRIKEQAKELRKKREEEKKQFQQEQKIKKEKVEEYKNKKSQLRNSQIVDSQQ